MNLLYYVCFPPPVSFASRLHPTLLHLPGSFRPWRVYVSNLQSDFLEIFCGQCYPLVLRVKMMKRLLYILLREICCHYWHMKMKKKTYCQILHLMCLQLIRILPGQTSRLYGHKTSAGHSVLAWFWLIVLQFYVWEKWTLITHIPCVTLTVDFLSLDIVDPADFITDFGWPYVCVSNPCVSAHIRVSQML